MKCKNTSYKKIQTDFGAYSFPTNVASSNYKSVTLNKTFLALRTCYCIVVSLVIYITALPVATFAIRNFSLTIYCKRGCVMLLCKLQLEIFYNHHLFKYYTNATDSTCPFEHESFTNTLNRWSNRRSLQTWFHTVFLMKTNAATNPVGVYECALSICVYMNIPPPF